MLHTSTSTIIGLLFAAVGGATVWLIFHATARMKQRGSSPRLIQAHRIGGYLFIALFAVMTYYMVIRLGDLPDEPAARPVTHMVLAFALVPLLFVKVLIARYYKTAFYSALLPLGLIIFSVSFVLVAMTAGPYLLRRATVEDISLESIQMGSETIDVGAAQSLMQQRCDTCHDLDRVVGARKDARAWLSTVNRMRALPGSKISADEARTITAYLVSRVGVDSSTPQGGRATGKALVDARCAKCHDLKQVYSAFKTPDAWRTTVDRMKNYAEEGHFEPGETDTIVRFLAETQGLDAEGGRIPVAAAATAAPPPAQPPAVDGGQGGGEPGSGAGLYVAFAVVATAFGALALRRPRASAPLAAATGAAPAPGPTGRPSVTLSLSRVERRTHDTKTFRFKVPEGERLVFKPGQFLTFEWVVDGVKAVRSYSICSSPMQTGYVEITVKRVPDGLVSPWLHDRAEIGMKVKVRGPSGKFVFDPAAHPRVALVVGGSGITAAMAILRSIEDRCLKVDATLIFAVRSPEDVIFGEELEAMRSRIDGFRLVVLASKGGEAWAGPTGRISRELVEATVAEPGLATWFLCGPPVFMDATREILASLGVDGARILSEKFGGLPAAAGDDDASAGVDGHVTFARSGVVCDIPSGRALLEVAEMNGVPIPSSCRQGQCGTCATRLVDGEVAMDAEDGLDASLRGAGFVLTCVGRARGNVVLDA
jgi:ferredoxin-NADP reductase/mono/diheme cytochrome c family protein